MSEHCGNRDARHKHRLRRKRARGITWEQLLLLNRNDNIPGHWDVDHERLLEMYALYRENGGLPLFFNGREILS